jgi:hypothetical protein
MIGMDDSPFYSLKQAADDTPPTKALGCAIANGVSLLENQATSL